VLFGTAGTLKHDRDVLLSLLTPGLEAFEAINHLVHAVVGRYDADG
jgi:hypothetical protein